jgi:hypothetical protein
MGSLRAMGRRNQIHPPSASGKTKLIQSAAPSTRGELNGYMIQVKAGRISLARIA